MRTNCRPKILFLTRSLDFGGAQRQLVELATGLHGAGWDVKVATFYGGGALASRLQDEGVPTISLAKAGRWDILRFTFRLVRLLRNEQPHVAHGYLDVANILLALLRWCVPRTRIVWGVRASNLDILRYNMLFRAELRMSVLLSRFADLIICNSNAGRTHHASRGFPARHMVVIPNGIDSKRFRPDPRARDEVRKEWQIEPDRKLIGLVGRLEPMKDQPGFLRAAARVAAVHPEAQFVCVGDGPSSYREELIQLSHTLGIADRVRWSNARPDVWRVHNALDVAISSSLSEGFSNTIAEAMATGVACVATDVGDSAAVVGDVGWICKPNDSESLASAISDALNALPVDQARIRERIVKNYSSAELVNRTAAHLAPLLGRVCVVPQTSQSEHA
jgi:glycosyltransferase involved in cell wall biosynthesis